MSMINDIQRIVEPSGFRLSEAAYEKLQGFHEMLMDWNTRIDLTNVPEEEMPLLHYADSLVPLAYAHLFPFGATLMDVGTGAGFPGLPLAIARGDMRVTLLDSLQKRCAFLEQVVKELKLPNVTVVHVRAEDAGRGVWRERFDVVTARAVAPLNVLCEYLLPVSKIGGKVLCWKGPSVAQELEAAKIASRVLGGQMGELLSLPLPGREHYIQVFEKIAHTPKEYPRKAGTPAKKPLG